MSSVKKIEEMLEGTEKKVHAGEWLRIDVVRNLMCDLAIWLNEEFKKDLIGLQNKMWEDSPFHLKKSQLVREEEE
jgi:hypothetical protein